MRGALGICLLWVTLSAGCWQSPGPSNPAEHEAPAAPARPGVPSWVPQRTPEQQALLAPTERPVRAPAEAGYPDLERFGYANNRPPASPEDAVKFTRMVAKVLDDSARFYVLGELPDGAANLVAQYGPRSGEPDGYKIVKREASGVGQLTLAPGAEQARAAVTRGEELV